MVNGKYDCRFATMLQSNDMVEGPQAAKVCLPYLFILIGWTCITFILPHFHVRACLRTWAPSHSPKPSTDTAHTGQCPTASRIIF